MAGPGGPERAFGNENPTPFTPNTILALFEQIDAHYQQAVQAVREELVTELGRDFEEQDPEKIDELAPEYAEKLRLLQEYRGRDIPGKAREITEFLNEHPGLLEEIMQPTQGPEATRAQEATPPKEPEKSQLADVLLKAVPEEEPERAAVEREPETTAAEKPLPPREQQALAFIKGRSPRPTSNSELRDYLNITNPHTIHALISRIRRYLGEERKYLVTTGSGDYVWQKPEEVKPESAPPTKEVATEITPSNLESLLAARKIDRQNPEHQKLIEAIGLEDYEIRVINRSLSQLDMGVGEIIFELDDESFESREGVGPAVINRFSSLRDGLRTVGELLWDSEENFSELLIVLVTNASQLQLHQWAQAGLISPVVIKGNAEYTRGDRIQIKNNLLPMTKGGLSLEQIIEALKGTNGNNSEPGKAKSPTKKRGKEPHEVAPFSESSISDAEIRKYFTEFKRKLEAHLRKRRKSWNLKEGLEAEAFARVAHGFVPLGQKRVVELTSVCALSPYIDRGQAFYFLSDLFNAWLISHRGKERVRILAKEELHALMHRIHDRFDQGELR